jgi:predicted unusual protein kinase regulating ubiquinone biosynthesis (AarF/ABC1/UbiB family)
MEELTAQTPNCIIHGDTHLGNSFVEPDGSTGFYDIVPRRAAPISEVCYHITLSMDVAQRPRWERELVKHYLAELARHDVMDAPDFDEAMRQYSAFLVEGYCLVLTNDAYFMPEPPITAYAARFSAAMLDHDTAGVLARYT